MAICAACMNINEVSRVKYWGALVPPAPLVPTPMWSTTFVACRHKKQEHQYRLASFTSNSLIPRWPGNETVDLKHSLSPQTELESWEVIMKIILSSLKVHVAAGLVVVGTTASLCCTKRTRTLWRLLGSWLRY